MLRKTTQTCFIILFVILTNTLTDCHKSGSFEVTGRVVDSTTKQPVSAKILIKGNDPKSSKNTADPVGIKEITTNNDGTFNTKFRTKSGKFYLYIDGKGYHQSSGGGIFLKENQNTDLGDIWPN